MTRGPELRLGRTLVPGVLAVVLFGAMAAIVLNVPFDGMPSDPFGGASVTANIGYALFDMTALQEIDSEPFLASLILVAVVLDAALDAALVLAKREEAGEPVAALATTPDAAETTDGEVGGPGSPATDGGRHDAPGRADEGHASGPSDGGERR